MERLERLRANSGRTVEQMELPKLKFPQRAHDKPRAAKAARRLKKNGSASRAAVNRFRIEKRTATSKAEPSPPLLQDITDGKCAEEKLRRSEAYLAEGERLTHSGTWAVNLSTGEIFWSQEMFRIYGLDPETKLHNPEVFGLIHPDDRAFIKKTFERAVRDKIDYDVNHRAILPDGTLKYIHSTGHPVLNVAGNVTEFVGMIVDVTERTVAEAALREAKARTEMILDSITDRFFALDNQWRFTKFNKHAEEQLRILGKDPAKLIGNTLWDEFPDPPTEETFRRAMRERTVITHEHYYAQLKEWVENRIYPSQDGGIAIYQRYVTDRKQAEEALHNAQAELAHVTRVTAIGELAASIAHQINQPLGAITNNGNVALSLLKHVRDFKELRTVLGDMVKDANRANRIIERVRALTLKAMSKRALLDLRKSIDEVLAITGHELIEKQILVKTHFAKCLEGLWADRVQMQQVLFNLVRNSIDAMKTVPAKKRVLLIRTQRGHLEGRPAAIITVRDSGCGFTPEEAGRLFDAFYTTKADGMGMGLRISRSIVEAHGGVLSARRNSGPGATFRFTLPISHKRVT